MTVTEIQNSRRGNPLIIGVVLSAIFFLHACAELQYSLFGKSATGTVTHLATREVYRKRSSWTELRLDYSFTDAVGTERDEVDLSDIDSWKTVPEVGDEVRVQYVQTGPARLAHWADPLAFAMLFAIVFLWLLWWAYSKLESESYGGFL